MESDYCIDVSTGRIDISDGPNNGERAFEQLVLNDGFKHFCEIVREEFDRDPNFAHSIIPSFDVMYFKVTVRHDRKMIPGLYDLCFSFSISGLLRTTDIIGTPWRNYWVYHVSKTNFRNIIIQELSKLDRPISGKGMVEIWMDLILKKVVNVYGLR